jgi:hypothetical protein
MIYLLFVLSNIHPAVPHSHTQAQVIPETLLMSKNPGMYYINFIYL